MEISQEGKDTLYQNGTGEKADRILDAEEPNVKEVTGNLETNEKDDKEKGIVDDSGDKSNKENIINKDTSADEIETEVKENGEKTDDTSDVPNSSSEQKSDVMDVLGSGEIMKKISKCGRGAYSRPKFGEVCIFNVTTKLPDGTVLDQKSNYKCILGQLEVVQALELSLMLMDVDEIAIITSSVKFTTPKLDFNPNYPEGTDKLVYEVELVDVDPIPNYAIMKSEELSTVLLRKKELGNFLMAKEDYNSALSTYNYAKEIIEQATHELDTSIKVAIWNNMAACYLKMQNSQSVVDYTNKVLALQPHNVKALFRKGKALAQRGDYKESLEVLNKGIQTAAEKDLKLFHQAASEVRQKMNKANDQERAMYKAMFNPDSKSVAEKNQSKGLSWWTVGAAAAVVVALGAALIRINLSNS